MIVMKFGGTSVGSPSRIKEIASLINSPDNKIVVLSAMAGTTNALVEIASHLYKKEKAVALSFIEELEMDYYLVVDELFTKSEFKSKALGKIKTHFDFIKSFAVDMFTLSGEKAVLAQGELISTILLNCYLQERKINSALLPALDFMRTDGSGEPVANEIKQNIENALQKLPPANIYITQGFICRNPNGEIDNLRRGGSDYSASLIGAAVEAEEIQIWTDIDGMHNNDPRYVGNTHPLSNLSFDEAAELAYFGAKILHPSSVLPAKMANIPVRLKNTMKPGLEGTLISSQSDGINIKAIAAKDNITAIKINSGRMLLAYGFLRKVFEIFETYKTPIDMITTSEVAVSVTIDNTDNLTEILTELKKYGRVEVDSNLSIVCVVGNFIAESKGYALKVFDALKNIPIRMISYGGSMHNVSLLVNKGFKIEALKSLNDKLF
ncbi:MAG: aspartate kinase [Chlorobi bacterium]|nr:aspartate kinase [Chlorobiota bacterium]